jgi:hypothetical protein
LCKRMAEKLVTKLKAGRVEVLEWRGSIEDNGSNL